MNKPKIEEIMKAMLDYRENPETIHAVNMMMQKCLKAKVQFEVAVKDNNYAYNTDYFTFDHTGYILNYDTMEYESTYNYRISYEKLYEALAKIHREALENRNLEICLLYDPVTPELYYYERAIGSNFLPSSAEVGVDIFLYSYEFHDLDPLESDEFMDLFIPKIAKSINVCSAVVSNVDGFCTTFTPYAFRKYARDGFPKLYEEALEEYFSYLADAYEPELDIEIIRSGIKDLGYIVE